MAVLPLDRFWGPGGQQDGGGGGVCDPEPDPEPDPDDDAPLLPYDHVYQAFLAAMRLLVPTSRIYEMLSLGLREIDERHGTGLIERYLQRPEQHYGVWRASIQLLSLSDRPDLCPEALLPYLKSHVGFTEELSAITRRLDSGTLRKLIALAIPLWKQKGTANGLVAAIRALTGLTPFYYDWFNYRFVLGETQIGEEQIGTDSWIIGGELSDYDEYTSQIKLADDGLLDKRLLVDLIILMRPASERIEIVLLDFIDLFDSPIKNRWITLSGTPAFVDVDEKVLVLPPGTHEEAVVPAFGSNYEHYTSVHKIQFGAPSDLYEIHWQRGGSEDLKLRVTPDFGTHGYNLELLRDATALDSIPFQGGITMVPGAWYKIRIETTPSVPGASRVRIYVDDEEQIERTLDSVSPGAFTVYSDVGNQENIAIDNVELWRAPLQYASIGPSGLKYFEEDADVPDAEADVPDAEAGAFVRQFTGGAPITDFDDLGVI